MNLLESPWLLLLVPFVARVFVREASGEDRWSTSVDLALSLACGMGLAAVGGLWLARFALDGWPVTAPEFTAICQSVASIQRGTLAYLDPASSLPAAWLPGVLSRTLGVIGGLAAASIVSLGVIGAALYLWGRAAHGRVAGVAAAMLGGAVAPLVVLSRTLTFSPEFVAACALCSATSMLAFRYRTAPALLAGGIGAAVLLVVEPRALLFVAIGVSLAGAGAFPQWLGHLPRRFAWVGVPVALGAVGTGPWAPGGVSPWGLLPAVVDADPPGVEALGALTAWIGPAVAAVTLWCVAMRRRPGAMGGFLLSLLPFLGVVVSGGPLDSARLALISLAVPVALGAALGAFVGAPAPARVALPVLALVVLLVVGLVPGWLSPYAGWRVAVPAAPSVRAYQMADVRMSNEQAHCVIALARDHRLGREWNVYPYPAARPEPLEEGGTR